VEQLKISVGLKKMCFVSFTNTVAYGVGEGYPVSPPTALANKRA
jgi:hypothetical protein